MRLIDAMEYRKCLEEEMDISDSDFHLGLEIAIADLGDMPTIDAVQVVRCRDCKYRDPENHHCGHVVGTMIYFPRKPNDFCSYGERRNND